MISRIQLLFIVSGLFFIACGRPEPVAVQKLSPEATFDSLITYVERMGDYINSDQSPSMISANEVYEQLDSNILVIDLRESHDFASAHISGAVNVPFNQVLSYFEQRINPSSFQKIVLVCYSGQVTAYATSILRLLGYSNVYNLRWGMSSWHRPTANAFWVARVSDKYSQFLEKTPNVKNPAGSYPSIETSETYGYSILRERAIKLFAEGFDVARVTVDELYEPNNNFYIVNYWPEQLYNNGHIPGAVLYLPRKSLSRQQQLNTLPTNRPVAIYCYTGQNSAFVVAYLRMLGYDAKGLIYGTNSFMNSIMVKEGIHNAFTEEMIKELPLSSGASEPKNLTEEPIVIAPRGGC